MRVNIAIALHFAAVMLWAASPIRADELYSNELDYGPESGFVTNDFCQGDCGLVCVCEPESRYSISANLLWLGRGKAASNPLVEQFESAPTLLLSTRDMEFNVEAGIDAGFRAHRPDGKAWELRYFGIFDQVASARRIHQDMDADPSNDAYVYHFLADFGPFNDVTTVYSSNLHSGEANLWLNERWGVEPVCGIRWVGQNESLESYDSHDSAEGTLVKFSNNLLGGQIGFRRLLWESPDRFRVEATVKGGVFANDMNLDSSYRTAGTVTPSISGSFNSAAYAGEIAITASWRLSSHLTARLGYTGFWLDRIGLAADQLDDFDFFSGAGDVDLTTLSYQGGHFGLELDW